MFIGHFAIALGAKRAAPKASLGTLIFCAQFADLLWPVLVLLGWEQVRIAPGITRVTPLDFVSYPYSHSLLADLLWGIGIGAIYWALRRDWRVAAILAACVPSHWLLDYASHRPDMPIVPGGPRYGLGLWNSMAGTVGVEVALFAIGTYLYLTITHSRDRVGTWAFWSLWLLLVGIYFSNLFGPPPPSASVIAWSAMGLWLTVVWAAWADRHRKVSGTLNKETLCSSTRFGSCHRACDHR